MMASNTIELPGEELNRRLEDLSLKIERISILIEDAMVDSTAVIALDRGRYNDLIFCLSKYEEFLESLGETTLDTTDAIREIVGVEECCYGLMEADDEEIDIVEDKEEDGRWR